MNQSQIIHQNGNISLCVCDMVWVVWWLGQRIKLTKVFEGCGGWLLLSNYCWARILASPTIPHFHLVAESRSAILGEAPTHMRRMQSTGQTTTQIIQKCWAEVRAQIQ